MSGCQISVSKIPHLGNNHRYFDANYNESLEIIEITPYVIYIELDTVDFGEHFSHEGPKSVILGNIFLMRVVKR